ncbi:MAG: hypothetical protein R3B09_24420 [Nannocystaceae bacterium]
MNDRIWTASRAGLALLLPALVGGCSLFGGGDDDDGSTTDPTQENINAYESLRLTLEASREQVLPAAMVDDNTSAGPWLVWLDTYQGWSAIFHARRFPDGAEVVSDVPIGDEENPPNFVISESLGMTARSSGSDSVYTVFRLDTGAELDVVTLKKPSAADYDAYALLGDDAYIVVEDEGLAIYEWTPGSTAPASIGSIDASLGAFVAFVVVEDTKGSRHLTAIGTYGTWDVDLATMAATKIPIPILPTEGGINERGLAAFDDGEIWWYEWGAAEARPIHDEIAASGYVLSSTFPQAHLPAGGLGGANLTIDDATTIYYRSHSGVYAYDVGTRAVTPVLLEDVGYSGSGLYITYAGLSWSDVGLFVVGLESMSGSTGADGPVYRVAR